MHYFLGAACTTKNGYACILPFYHNGNLFETCLPYPGGTKYWCATVVGNDSEFLDGPTNWDICDSTCPTPTSQNFTKVYSSLKKIDLPKDSIEFRKKDQLDRTIFTGFMPVISFAQILIYIIVLFEK